MSHIEQKPSNLPDSFDNIPAIDDDDQGLRNIAKVFVFAAEFFN